MSGREGWVIERPATGLVVARGPGGEVAIEEPCRRCGARVIGALDETGKGVFLESGAEQEMRFHGGMPFAGRGLKRHTHPEAK